MDAKKALKTLKDSQNLGETIAVAVGVLEDLEKIQTQKAAAEKAHQNVTALYLGLRAKADNLDKELIETARKVDDMRLAKSDLEAELPKMQREAADLRQRLSAEIEEDNKRAAAARQEASEAQRQLDQLKARVEEEKVRLDRLVNA